MAKMTYEIASGVLNAEPYSLEWWARYTCRLRLDKAVARSQEARDDAENSTELPGYLRKLKKHKVEDLPVYLQEWKRDYDESWRERWKQYYETWDRLKESLPKRGEFTASRRSGVAFYPDIDLEEWK